MDGTDKTTELWCTSPPVSGHFHIIDRGFYPRSHLKLAPKLDYGKVKDDMTKTNTNNPRFHLIR